jgi:dipeptide transport system permease protein
MKTTRFIQKRFLQVLFTLVGVSFCAFAWIRLAPGDPVQLLLGEHGADPSKYQEVKHQLGLDQTFFEQYQNFIFRALHGDLGTSLVTSLPVTQEFFSRWPATLELGFSAFLISVLVGIPTGIWAALNQNRLFDRILLIFSSIVYSMPMFWWSMILILFISVQFGLTPVSGRLGTAFDITPWSGFYLIDCLRPDVLREYGLNALLNSLHHLTLPAFSLATLPALIFARSTRSSMIETLNEDYVRTARARGISPLRITFRYAFRNALAPVITVAGILFIVTTVSGAILTETLFGWPGIGSYLIAAMQARDYPATQGSILIIGIAILIVNFFVDIIVFWLNPKLRT